MKNKQMAKVTFEIPMRYFRLFAARADVELTDEMEKEIEALEITVERSAVDLIIGEDTVDFFTVLAAIVLKEQLSKLRD